MRKFSCVYQAKGTDISKPSYKNTWNAWRNLVCWSRGRLVKKSEVMQRSYIVEFYAHGKGFVCRVKAITMVRFEKE